MNNVTKIIKVLTNDPTKLSTVLKEFETELDGYADDLKIQGKTLETALKEQAGLSARYSEMVSTLDFIVELMETQYRTIRCRYVIQYNENYNPKLSERMLEKYVDNEQEVQDAHIRYLTAKELLDVSKAIVDAFNKRGFALRDITAARINAIHTDVL